MTKHTPATPQDFTAKFPRYVYRSHKGQVSVQWREAALDIYEDRRKLVEALHYLSSKVEDGDDALGTQQGRVIAQALLRSLGEDA